MDERRKRARFRAWRRGFREIDLIMGGFAESHLPGLSEADLAEFERLLDQPDQDVYAWITEAAPVPQEFDTPLLGLIQRARYAHEVSASS